MKTKLFLVVAICMAVTANAQLVTTSNYTIKKEESKTVWFVRAGLNVANVSGGVDYYDKVGSIAGYNLSIEFNREFASNFYWGAGLVLATGGYEGSESWEDRPGVFVSYTDKYSVSKLEVPINIGYKYDLAHDVKLDAHIGAYFGYDLFGTNTFESKEGGEIHSEKISLGEWANYNRMNGGLQFGVGLWYRNTSVS